MAAEETKNPAKDIPKALIMAFITLAVIGLGTLTVAAGVGGSDFPGAAAPLTVALANVVGSQTWIVPVIAVFSLAALVASFHAIVIAYSRQTFALSRAGYLPAWLSKLNKHHAPIGSLIVPGVIGFVFVVLGDTILPDAIPVLVTLSVLVAAVSYMLMMAAALVLRKKRPDLHRPYKARGGRVTMWIALILAGIADPRRPGQLPARVRHRRDHGGPVPGLLLRRWPQAGRQLHRRGRTRPDRPGPHRRRLTAQVAWREVALRKQHCPARQPNHRARDPSRTPCSLTAQKIH